MALLLLRSQKSELKLALLEPSHLPAEPKSTQSNRHELVHSDHTDSQNLPLKTQGLSAPANQDIGLPPPPPTPTLTSLSLFTFLHWRRKWQPTPVFLPGESQGRWSLVGCRPWGRRELDMTEAT